MAAVPQQLRATRKERGAWYTPAALAAEIVARAMGAIEPRVHRVMRIVDPACGDGAFLRAALDALEGWYRARGRGDSRGAIAERHLFGAELDPRAADAARAIGANVATGDALLDVAWEKGTFDVVIGNPPYVESAVLAARDPDRRARIKARWATARGNWDLFVPFVELAIDLAKPGGAIGLVVPNKIASADYASALRAKLDATARVTWSRAVDGAFDAAVYPMAFVATKGQGARAGASSSHLGVSEAPALAGVPLGEIAEVSGAATVAEAYAMRELVVDGERGLKVVNSGTIDRGAFLWGARPMRYLGRDYARPVVRDVAKLPPRRLAQARAPKIVVAGLSKRLECALDARGEVLAAKSTCVITSEVDLRFLVRVLNSAIVSDWFRARFGGNALAGGYLRVGPKQLAAIPIAPSDAEARARVAALDDDGAVDRAVARLYGVSEAGRAASRSRRAASSPPR